MQDGAEPGVGAAQHGAVEVPFAAQALAVEPLASLALQGDAGKQEVVEAGERRPQLAVPQRLGRGAGGEPGLAFRHQPDRLGDGEEAGAVDPQPLLPQQSRAPFQVPHPGDALPGAGRPSRLLEAGLGTGAQLLESPWRGGAGEAAAEPGQPGVEVRRLLATGRQRTQAGAGSAHGEEPQAMAAAAGGIAAAEDAASFHRAEMDAGARFTPRHGEHLGHPLLDEPHLAGGVEGQGRVAGEREDVRGGGLSRQDRLRFRFGGHDPTRC